MSLFLLRSRLSLVALRSLRLGVVVEGKVPCLEKVVISSPPMSGFIQISRFDDYWFCLTVREGDRRSVG